MARTTSKGLYVWDLTTDSFNHVQLAANWDLVNSYWVGFDSTTKLPRRIHTTTTFPTGGTAGDICMLTATDNGYQPYTILKYDGSFWRPIGFERVPSVPTAGNFAGRVVMLTAADGSFNAYDLIRFDGSTWAIVGGFYTTSTGSGALNISGMSTNGDIFFTNGNRGVVFTDRTSGLTYRLYIDSGDLRLEKVT
jgi:hypothetical protein